MAVRCREVVEVVEVLELLATYHSDPFKRKDGRPKEEGVVSGLAHLWKVDGISDILYVGKKKRLNLGLNIQ